MAGEGPEQGPERGPSRALRPAIGHVGRGCGNLWGSGGLWGAPVEGFWGIPARALRGALSKAPGGAPTWSRGWGVRGSGRVFLGARGGWWEPPRASSAAPSRAPTAGAPHGQ